MVDEYGSTGTGLRFLEQGEMLSNVSGLTGSITGLLFVVGLGVLYVLKCSKASVEADLVTVATAVSVFVAISLFL